MANYSVDLIYKVFYCSNL